jgi:hypothetical protein
MVVEWSPSQKPDEAENGSGEPRKKRRTTDAQRDAARRNSQASQGPHDTSRTRLNAITHGLTCELPVVMPGESAQDVQNRINVYIAEQGAETQAEKDLLELSAMNFVRGRRANKAEVAADTDVVAKVERGFVDEARVRLATLIDELATAPAATITALRNFSMGIAWTLTQVESLLEHLRTNRSFHPSQRIMAIHMCGVKPCHLFTDPLVKAWNIHYLSALHGPGKITAEEAAEILENDRPEGVGPEEYARRLGDWLRELVDPRQGHAWLKETLAAIKADLLEWRAIVAEREAEDRERAIEAAKVSVKHEIMLRRRYRRDCQRGQESAMGKFLQMLAMRLKHPDVIRGLDAAAGDDDQREAEVQADMATPSEPAAAAPEEASTPPPAAGEAGQRNEAGAPQAPGGHGGKVETGDYSFIDIAIGRPGSGLDVPVPGNEGPGFGEFQPLRE